MDIDNLHPSFQHRSYLFRRKVFKLFGGAFHIYDSRGNVVFYSKQKAFKIREDVRIFSDESCTQEILSISTPHILDFGAQYHVSDQTLHQSVGSIRRKGLKSILKDEWTFMDREGMVLGTLKETSSFGAIASRLLNLIPQNYEVHAEGQLAAVIKQHFNPFILRYSMAMQPGYPLDPRLLIAAGVLLCAIEGRQD